MVSSTTERLLLVEDDRAVARAIVRLLRRRGYSVSIAHTRRAALEVEGRHLVGVLDIDLPDANGLELARELLDSERIQRVVFFSASPRPDVAQQASGLGEFVHKTEGIAELARAIADATTDTRRSATAAGIAVGDESVRQRDSDSWTRHRIDSAPDED